MCSILSSGDTNSVPQLPGSFVSNKFTMNYLSLSSLIIFILTAIASIAVASFIVSKQTQNSEKDTKPFGAEMFLSNRIISCKKLFPSKSKPPFGINTLTKRNLNDHQKARRSAYGYTHDLSELKQCKRLLIPNETIKQAERFNGFFDKLAVIEPRSLIDLTRLAGKSNGPPSKHSFKITNIFQSISLK